MKVLDKIRLVVYRVHEKGLEVFLVGPDDNVNEELFSIPEGENAQSFMESVDKSGLKLIQLEPVADQDGSKVSAFAIEGDWHDIPSIKALLQRDVDLVKTRLAELMPSTDSGAFVVVKDAFKRVLPYEYSMLKELKEILTEKNVIQNI
jgi:NDP-sugar pyrophosphorylase family protein